MDAEKIVMLVLVFSPVLAACAVYLYLRSRKASAPSPPPSPARPPAPALQQVAAEKARTDTHVTDAAIYELGAFFTGAIVFIGSWIYCIAEYGFLLGVGLGWLPSMIVAGIAGFLWPVIAIVLVLAAFAIGWLAFRR